MAENNICLQFREEIKAYGFENYKGVSVVYIFKPEDTGNKICFHYFYNNEMGFGEMLLSDIQGTTTAEILSAIQPIAQKEIDNLIANNGNN